MKRRLILMRHAKASYQSPATTDKERPLTERGRREAPLVAQALVRRGWIPDHVLASDAHRTLETWELMSACFEHPVSMVPVGDLYGTGIKAVQEVLARMPAALETILLLGHNPGWEEAVGWLSGSYPSLGTANAVLLEGAGTTWAEAVGGGQRWSLVAQLRPADL